jgi:imidazole glycerol-phosphate synthase subunit HisH
MIIVVESPTSNASSVCHMLDTLSVKYRLISENENILSFSGLILPGVGNFGAFDAYLRDTGLRDFLEKAILNSVPVLGICLGMQYLTKGSLEAPKSSGLGVFDTSCAKFDDSLNVVPHVGWNENEIIRYTNILSTLETKFATYFCHSYFVPVSSSFSKAVCDYGQPFSSVIQSGVVTGVQFHPEKSQKNGMKLLESFSKLCYLNA